MAGRATIGYTSGPESLDFNLRVELDNYAGARLAVRHLLATGRRDIAHLAGPLREGRERERGWRDELAEAGLPGRCEQGGYTLESGLRCGEKLVQEGLPDAVFAAGDFMAAGVLQAFQRAGVKVPGEVALVGFDDAAFASLLFPALTTVRQPRVPYGSDGGRTRATAACR